MAELLLLSRWLDAVPGFLSTRAPIGARLAFVPTASSIYPDPAWLDVDRHTLREQGNHLVELEPDRMQPDEYARVLDTVDAVFVSGGNVFHLLEVCRRTGFDDALTARVRAGLPYLGVSAGACIAGVDIEPLGLIDDPSEARPLDSTAGFGWIDEVIVPHADGTICGTAVIDDLRSRYHTRHTLRFLDDAQALLVSGDSRSVLES